MSSFIPTEKYADLVALALKPFCHLIVAEGSIRSSKTEFFKPAFMFAVFDSDEELHLIAANDLDSINDNILEGEHGLFQMFPKHLSLRKDKIGGYYVHVKGYVPMNNPKDKKILLAGYSNANKWKKVLGKTLGCIFIDEVNTANKQFVDECFARQGSVKKPLQLWTLNGDVPSHWIYTDYINRCNIVKKYRHEVPASIIADMDKVPKQKGWYYIHWNMRNNPTMDEEKIQRTSSVFPVGSYYYTIKILGERGAPGLLIFNEYMSDALIVDINEKDAYGRPKYIFNFYTIGIDIGASRAYNSFALIGWTADYKYCCVVDLMAFKAVGYDKKTPMLEAFIDKHKTGKYINCIAVDSAEQNYIVDLQGKLKRYGIPIRGSDKATIKKRIDMNIIGFSSQRVLFSKNCTEAFNAFLVAKWVEGKEGMEREDLNEIINDIMDSIEYGQTVFITPFLTASGR